MARKHRTHLLVRGKPACGRRQFRSASTDPRRVSCHACQGTLHMADAEVRLVYKHKRSTHHRKESS